jgi:hypothetical protein
MCAVLRHLQEEVSSVNTSVFVCAYFVHRGALSLIVAVMSIMLEG